MEELYNYGNFVYINDEDVVIRNVSDRTTVDIYDVMGRNVIRLDSSDKTNDELHVSVSSFDSGVYIVRIKDAENVVRTQKIVVR